MQTDELASLLELCYGDADDDESGLAELRTQLEVYPDRVAPFRAQLEALIASGDVDACKDLLETRTHQFMTGPEALAWLRGLALQLG